MWWFYHQSCQKKHSHWAFRSLLKNSRHSRNTIEREKEIGFERKKMWKGELLIIVMRHLLSRKMFIRKKFKMRVFFWYFVTISLNIQMNTTTMPFSNSHFFRHATRTFMHHLNNLVWVLFLFSWLLRVYMKIAVVKQKRNFYPLHPRPHPFPFLFLFLWSPFVL